MEEETLLVGSERYIFKKTWDAECSEGEAPYAFSDELDDYTFWPYSGKLKALPGYEGNEDEFEDARIYLMIKDPKKLIKVPCTVWEEMSRIYMTDGNFNKYWRYISKRMYEGIRRSNPERKNILQREMNQKVELSLMETPFRTAKIGSSYTIEYEGRQADIEMQRQISKKASALDDNKIRYIFSNKDNLVHDKTCSWVSKIHYSEFGAMENFPEGREVCSSCKRKLYLRSMLGDDNIKHFQWYVRMFQQGSVSTNTIESLAMTHHAKLFMPVPDILQVKLGEDTWQISENGEHKFLLYHNNYSMVSDDERYITSGFHLQMEKPVSLPVILRYIEGYDWKKHLEAKKAQQVAEAALTAMPEAELEKGEKDIDLKQPKKSMWRRLFERIRKIIMGR